jgi:SAM-dependent methyltransferase
VGQSSTGWSQKQLRPLLSNNFGLTAAELRRAQSIIDQILQVTSFAELYDVLGFEYAIERSGSLKQFSNDSFQLVVSGGVLEHVKREALQVLVGEMARIVKPGGWQCIASIRQIILNITTGWCRPSYIWSSLMGRGSDYLKMKFNMLTGCNEENGSTYSNEMALNGSRKNRDELT